MCVFLYPISSASLFTSLSVTLHISPCLFHGFTKDLHPYMKCMSTLMVMKKQISRYLPITTVWHLERNTAFLSTCQTRVVIFDFDCLLVTLPFSVCFSVSLSSSYSFLHAHHTHPGTHAAINHSSSFPKWVRKHTGFSA